MWKSSLQTLGTIKKQTNKHLLYFLKLGVKDIRMQGFRYRDRLARGICGFNLGAVVGTGALVIVFQEITWSRKTSKTWASKVSLALVL